MHDLHEASTYLYTSTGTGPYNEALDPITINEWWMLATTEVMEMTKRGVPGVWTYGFYDGWVPNYMFFIAHAHNAIGRFYEVSELRPRQPRLAGQRDHDEPRVVPPQPAAADDQVGPAQQHEHPAVGRALRAQPRREERIDLPRELLAQEQALGREGPGRPDVRVGDPGRRSARSTTPPTRSTSSGRKGPRSTRPTRAFKAGTVAVEAGDWIIRADQPYRTLADMYTSVQNYAPANPRPYDDTGWTMQLMRNMKLHTVTDKSILEQPMTPDGRRRQAGRRDRRDAERSSSSITPPTTRWSRCASPHASVAMQAAEDDFEAGGRQFRAGRVHHPERRPRRARAAR